MIEGQPIGQRFLIDIIVSEMMQEYYYEGMVSSQEHVRACQQIGRFADNAIKFMEQMLHGNDSLFPVTRVQANLLGFVKYCTESGFEFGFKEITRGVDRRLRPYIVLSIVYAESSLDLNLTFRWDVKRGIPLGFSIVCPEVPTIDFLVLQQKADTPEQVAGLLGLPRRITVDVQDSGDTVMLTRYLPHQGRTRMSTDKFHLIGLLEKGEGGQGYWIYGCNDAFDHKLLYE